MMVPVAWSASMVWGRILSCMLAWSASMVGGRITLCMLGSQKRHNDGLIAHVWSIYIYHSAHASLSPCLTQPMPHSAHASLSPCLTQPMYGPYTFITQPMPHYYLSPAVSVRHHSILSPLTLPPLTLTSDLYTALVNIHCHC